jgi:tRNA pseudouridine-54 N-methylase
LVKFLLLIDDVSKFSKVDIDQGKTPYDVYIICSCVRETFCLSYSIRKSNKLYIYIQKQDILIKFQGSKLRYLGPDERSQALLLEKAVKKLNKIISPENDDWLNSTPGIFIRKFNTRKSFMSYISSVIQQNHSFLIGDKSNFNKKVNFFNVKTRNNGFWDNSFFIIPTQKISEDLHKLIQKFKEMKNIKIISLSKIKSVENKILYINFRRDRQELQY